MFNFRPLFFTALFLCFGILFGYFVYAAGMNVGFAALPLTVVLLFVLFAENKKRAGLFALALVFAFSLGNATFSLSVGEFERAEAVDGYYTVEGRIVERSVGGENAIIVVSALSLDGEAVKGRMIAYLPASYNGALRLSDTVRFTSHVHVNIQTSNVYGFRAEAIAKDNRFSAGRVEKIEVTGHKTDLFFAVRERIVQTVQAGMDETPAAVTLAVLLGDTSAIDEGLLENIRYGGIAHVFAVSGLHVGSLFACFVALIKKTRLKGLPPLARFLVVAALLLFYGGVCGYSASVIRASVTCLALYAYKLLGLKSDGLENLSLAVICVLIVNPTQLFGVGFQLSFAASYGIALLSRPIRESVGGLFEKSARQKERLDYFREEQPPTLWEKNWRGAIDFFAVSLSAQAFTWPILLLNFGYLSAAGLLLNCLFVPLLSAVFFPLLCFVAVASLVAAFESVLLLAPNLLLSAMLLLFQAVEFSTVFAGATLSVGGVLSYYGALLFCIDKWNVSKLQKLMSVVVFLIAFFICL